MENKCEFEVGKWYKYQKWYLKYLKHDNGIWVASEHITDTGKYKSYNANFGSKDCDCQKMPCSIEEIQQYLPEGHPDKISVVKSNQEFKVGDYVVIVSKSLSTLKEGQITIITSIKDRKIMTPELDKKYPDKTGWLNSKEIRHATPDEINNHLISTGIIPAGEHSDNIKQPKIMEDDLNELNIKELHDKGLIKRVFEEKIKVPFENLPDNSLCSYKFFFGKDCDDLSCDDCFLNNRNRSKLKQLLDGDMAETTPVKPLLVYENGILSKDYVVCDGQYNTMPKIRLIKDSNSTFEQVELNYLPEPK